jgi:hypothetical protein
MLLVTYIVRIVRILYYDVFYVYFVLAGRRKYINKPHKDGKRMRKFNNNVRQDANVQYNHHNVNSSLKQRIRCQLSNPR